MHDLQPLTASYPHDTRRMMRAAAVIFSAGMVAALLIPDTGWRVLAAIFTLPWGWWGCYQWRLSRSGLILDGGLLTVRRPLWPRPLRIPLAQIGGVMTWPKKRLGLIYYTPRPMFEGAEDPRPPRKHSLITLPLTDGDALLHALQQAVASREADPLFPAWDNETLAQQLRRYQRNRTGLRVGLVMITPLLVILGVRLAFTVYAVLHNALLK